MSDDWERFEAFVDKTLNRPAEPPEYAAKGPYWDAVRAWLTDPEAPAPPL